MAKTPDADRKVLTAQQEYQREVEGLVQDWQALSRHVRELRRLIGVLGLSDEAPDAAITRPSQKVS
jgi:hypothetical protein